MTQACRACTIATSPMSDPASAPLSASGLDALPETAVSGARSTTAACTITPLFDWLDGCQSSVGADACDHDVETEQA